MTMTGEVSAKEERDGRQMVTIKVTGMNRMGPHVMGSVELELP